MTHETEKAKMLAGVPYFADDPALALERRRAKELCARYNRTVPDLDRGILRELLGYDTDAHLEPPFFCDYGPQIRIGRRLYANHNLVILDCALVTIGDSVMIGPNTVITTVGHPTDPARRTAGEELARPIRLGDEVWLGASVTILPGVEIGEGTTIGAGSVVTRSIPARCVAVGNPCRVLKMLD